MLVSLTASTEPPSGIAIQPDPVLPVVLSQSVNLMCTATGDPPITYAWVLTGAETTCLNSDPTSGDFTPSITQMNQYGVYICIATNVLGTDVTSIEIIQASKSTIYNSWAPNPRYLWALSCSVSVQLRFLSHVDVSGWLCRINIVTVSNCCVYIATKVVHCKPLTVEL